MDAFRLLILVRSECMGYLVLSSVSGPSVVRTLLRNETGFRDALAAAVSSFANVLGDTHTFLATVSNSRDMHFAPIANARRTELATWLDLIVQ